MVIANAAEMTRIGLCNACVNLDQRPVSVISTATRPTPEQSLRYGGPGGVGRQDQVGG